LVSNYFLLRNHLQRYFRIKYVNLAKIFKIITTSLQSVITLNHPSQPNNMTIVESVWLGLYMRKMYQVQNPTRSLSRTERYSIFNTYKWQQRTKNNIYTGQLFTAVTQHLTPAIVKYKHLDNMWSLVSINYNKITWRFQTPFDLICTWGIMKKCNILHARYHRLSDTQFSKLTESNESKYCLFRFHLKQSMFFEIKLKCLTFTCKTCCRGAEHTHISHNWLQYTF
jgi:hypothetical protein